MTIILNSQNSYPFKMNNVDEHLLIHTDDINLLCIVRQMVYNSNQDWSTKSSKLSSKKMYIQS